MIYLKPRLKTSMLTLSQYTLGIFVLLVSSNVWAQLSLSTLEPNTIEQGQSIELTLYGGGFGDMINVSFEAAPDTEVGVTVQGQPMLVTAAEADDGRGDRLVFTASATATAPVGGRNLVVSNANDTRTKFSALMVRAGSGGNTGGMNNGGMNMGGMNTDPNDDPAPNSSGNGGLYESLPPREAGSINVITRASPPKGEVGGQVNLWIEGREFPPDVEVKFNTTAIEPALNTDSMVIPQQVFRNTTDTGGELDGILYYARISGDAPLGPVSITLSSPSTGARKTEEGLFEIVEQGQGLVFDNSGAEDIEQVSSASPLAVRAGRNVALWVLGQGFNIDSSIQFSNPSVQSVRPSEVVIEAQNAPGYDGIRNYLQIPPTAAPGPVSVTVTNPNSTTQTGVDLFEIIPPASVEGATPIPGGSGGDACEGDDFEQNISEIVAANPGVVAVGQETDLRIYARGLACRASFILYGGGIEVIGDTPVYQDTSDPALRFFQLRIKVNRFAPLGPRKVTILNPNGSSKTRDNVFEVVVGASGTGAACQNLNSKQPLFILLCALFGITLLRLRLRKSV